MYATTTPRQRGRWEKHYRSLDEMLTTAMHGDYARGQRARAYDVRLGSFATGQRTMPAHWTTMRHLS
jgi:hypothetical protein